MTASQDEFHTDQPVTSEPRPEEFEERWRFTELGEAFGRKYKHVRILAKRGNLRSDENASWWRESAVAQAIGLKPEQWSNVRSRNPDSRAFLYPQQLHQLVKRFQLDQALGRQAWKLFTPAVSFEALDAALLKAHYGGYEQYQPPTERRYERFVIPQLDPFVLRCPATLDEYDQTVEITRATFDHDLIDLEADRNAFIRNPYTMVILVAPSAGEVIGWIDIYHLPDDDLTLMLEDGRVRVDPARTIDFPASCKATRAYTASIAVKPSHSGVARILIYGMMEFLLKFQFEGTNTFELFAIGSTEQGKNLLTRLRFEFVRMMEMEVGLGSLYSRKFSKEELIHEQRVFWRGLGLYRPEVSLEICNPLQL